MSRCLHLELNIISFSGQRTLPQPDKWMANVYNAISNPCAEGFEYQFSEQDGDLKV